MSRVERGWHEWTITSDAIAVASGAVLGGVAGAAVGFGGSVITLLIVGVAGMGAVMFALYLVIIATFAGVVADMGLKIRRRSR